MIKVGDKVIVIKPTQSMCFDGIFVVRAVTGVWVGIRGTSFLYLKSRFKKVVKDNKLNRKIYPDSEIKQGYLIL